MTRAPDASRSQRRLPKVRSSRASFVAVQNLNRTLERPPRVLVCDSFGSRLRGLMFRPAISRDEGVLLVMPQTTRLDSSIHMFFVPFDLAVFWIDADQKVVDKAIARSWRPAYVPAHPARYVLELHPDLFAAYDVGQKVEFANV